MTSSVPNHLLLGSSGLPRYWRSDDFGRCGVGGGGGNKKKSNRRLQSQRRRQLEGIGVLSSAFGGYDGDAG